MAVSVYPFPKASVPERQKHQRPWSKKWFRALVVALVIVFVAMVITTAVILRETRDKNISSSLSSSGNSIFSQLKEKCPKGFYGENCEKQSNECESSPCQHGSTCIDGLAMFGCVCTVGFRGVLCEENIDDCASGQHCKNGGKCIDGINQYECECSPGYEGVHCEIDIDECESEPCQYGGTCENRQGEYICVCNTKFSGPQCQFIQGNCSHHKCTNNATCIENENGYACVCKSGYEGLMCDINIDECENATCKNGATCEDDVNNYSCVCVSGYDGSQCETNINECFNNLCINGATCVDGVNNYTCTCTPGYSGTFCETNIDECASNPCPTGTTCVDGIAQFLCECPEGKAGDDCSRSIFNSLEGSLFVVQNYTSSILNQTIIVDWGDNSTTDSILWGQNHSHIYWDDGFYKVVYTSTEEKNFLQNVTFYVQVFNVAPNVTINENVFITTFDEGFDILIHNPAFFTDPGKNDTFLVVVDYGDNRESFVNYTLVSYHTYVRGNIHFFLHKYAHPIENCIVTYNVTDNQGDSNIASTIITIENIPPAFITNFLSRRVDEGSLLRLTTVEYVYDYGYNDGNSISDERLYLIIDYDTGDVDTINISNISLHIKDGVPVSRGRIFFEYRFPDEGEYFVFLTVFDNVGGSAQESMTVIVDNVPPTILWLNISVMEYFVPYNSYFYVGVGDFYVQDPGYRTEQISLRLSWGYVVNNRIQNPIATFLLSNTTYYNITDGNRYGQQTTLIGNTAYTFDEGLEVTHDRIYLSMFVNDDDSGEDSIVKICDLINNGGSTCAEDIDDCISSPCQNGGTCIDEVFRHNCSCVAGYGGINCNTEINECDSEPCQNGATCIDNFNGFACTCLVGYSGLFCQININDCASNPCQNGGTCVDGLSMYDCECVAGYEGTHCETNIDECASNPCLNGTTCIDKINHYTCSCGSYTDPFYLFQEITMDGIQDWVSFFSINGDSYMATANYRSSETANYYTLNSHVYKYNPSSLEFEIIQDIETHGARDIESFQIDNRTFIAFANERKVGTFSVNSTIYEYNSANDNFTLFQSIPTEGARDWEYFYMGTEHFLAVANYGDDSCIVSCNEDSQVYKYDPRAGQFVDNQAIPTRKCTDFEYFEMDGNSYLAYTEYDAYYLAWCPYPYTCPTAATQTNSKVMKYNTESGEFEILQNNLQTLGAVDFEFFQIDGLSYLVVANNNHFVQGQTALTYEINSRIFKFDKNSNAFAAEKDIATKGATDWEVFVMNGKTYLSVSNSRNTAGDLSQNSTVYQYDGTTVVTAQNIATEHAADSEYFEMDGRSYLAIANYLNNTDGSYTGYTANSKIFIGTENYTCGNF